MAGVWSLRRAPKRVPLSDSALLIKAADHRAKLRAAGRCIAGPLEGEASKRSGIVHGPVYKGGRCKRCWDVKTGAARAAGAADLPVAIVMPRRAA